MSSRKVRKLNRNVYNDRGWLGIAIWHGKITTNVGMLMRAAYNFDAAFIALIGGRYTQQPTDTCKMYRHIPLLQPSDDSFWSLCPYNCPFIAVEIVDQALPLETFQHPQRAIYILGGEDQTLPPSVLDRCHYVLRINTQYCMNVAIAGSTIMYDRHVKNVWKKKKFDA